MLVFNSYIPVLIICIDSRTLISHVHLTLRSLFILLLLLISVLSVLQVSAADIVQTQDNGKGKDDTSGHNSLEAAFGAGKGKHAGKKRRRHSNKYSSKSKTAELDPWEEQLQQADKTLQEAEARARKELEELEERREQRRLERGEVDYPDEEDIDPYDPSTFGYIEVKRSNVGCRTWYNVMV